jgi:hypothetical protein
MDKKLLKIQILILIAAIFLIPRSGSAQGPVKGTYLYNLSSFTGNIPYSWPRVQVDKEGKEIYVIYQNLIRIFNANGMEIYRFGDELDLGTIVDLIVDKEGDILLLSHGWSETSKRVDFEITRCNYRGEPISKIELKNLPAEFSGFLPNRMTYRKENLYLASLSTMTVVVTNVDGLFKEGYDILPLLELEEKDKEGAMMVGFSVDGDGNILFTIPPVFKAYVLTPERKIYYFGKPGSAPGRFNIIAGIVSDSKGNILIVDKLKCAVMVYDKDFRFLNQFSSRGFKKGDLITPDDITIDSNDRIYVTQARNRGISVFKLNY